MQTLQGKGKEKCDIQIFPSGDTFSHYATGFYCTTILSAMIESVLPVGAVLVLAVLAGTVLVECIFKLSIQPSLKR